VWLISSTHRLWKNSIIGLPCLSSSSHPWSSQWSSPRNLRLRQQWKGGELKLNLHPESFNTRSLSDYWNMSHGNVVCILPLKTRKNDVKFWDSAVKFSFSLLSDG
jgi:hypothetical protein